MALFWMDMTRSDEIETLRSALKLSDDSVLTRKTDQGQLNDRLRKSSIWLLHQSDIDAAAKESIDTIKKTRRQRVVIRYSGEWKDRNFFDVTKSKGVAEFMTSDASIFTGDNAVQVIQAADRYLAKLGQSYGKKDALVRRTLTDELKKVWTSPKLLALSHFIHELHNRTAALRLDIETLEALKKAGGQNPQRQEFYRVLGEILNSAIGSDAPNCGYLTGTRGVVGHSQSLSRFLDSLLTGTEKVGDISLPSIAAQYPTVSFALDCDGVEIAEKEDGSFWWQGSAKSTEWTNLAKDRHSEFEQSLGVVVRLVEPNEVYGGDSAEDALRSLKVVQRWLDSLDGYLRRLRLEIASSKS